jgi:hypothetical protein
MSKDELSAALAACAADLQAFADARDWGQFHTPKNLAMSLAIEAGEVMEHFQWTAPEAATPVFGALVAAADAPADPEERAGAAPHDQGQHSNESASARAGAKRADILSP